MLRALRLVRVRRVAAGAGDAPAPAGKSLSIKRSVSGKSSMSLAPVDTSVGIAAVGSARGGAGGGGDALVWALEEWAHRGKAEVQVEITSYQLDPAC